MAGFYIVQEPDHQWGDHGRILMHGMSCHLDRRDGLIQLERTGPYVPPISFPGIGDIVVTDGFRRQLEASGLSGFCFRPIIKARIVRLDWHRWNPRTDDPRRFPRSGEPEDYILERRHSSSMSQWIGDLWEVVLAEGAVTQRVEHTTIDNDVYLLASSWRGVDLFHAEGVGYIYATERAKDWLEEHVRGFVHFTAVPTK